MPLQTADALFSFKSPSAPESVSNAQEKGDERSWWGVLGAFMST